MERVLLGEYSKGLCFHSRGQFQATWNESAQNTLGKAQSPADWHGRFHSSMYKWGLAPPPICEYGATEHTADHLISSCLIHHVPRGTQGLQIFDDATRCWLNTTTASI